MSDAAEKTLLLISNKVYHYRIPVYEHLGDRLKTIGYRLVVIANEIEPAADPPQNFRLEIKPFSYRDYRQSIDAIDPDIVMFFLHIRDWLVWPLMIHLRSRRTPVIYWNHGVNLQAPDSRIRQAIFGLFHRFSDAIVLYSTNERKYIADRYQYKVFVANNTINFDTIPDIPESRDEIRSALGVPFDRVVLFVGRVTAAKRLDDLLLAAPRLSPGTGVVVVGDGLSDAQRALIDAADNVLHLGALYDRREVNRVFKMADVFSIPGKVGLGVNQAFYWGLPIVTENVRHSPEIVYVRDGVNGFIVDKDDPGMLADRINELLSSDELYNAFSEAARNEILENASIDKMCDGFIEAVDYLERDSHSHAG